jgi:dTDP-4-dehydrorhamnose reductase
MKFLLTGKNGQVGFELQRALAPLGVVVAVDQAECDLADAVALRQLLRQVVPDVIVHPAAYTAVDKAETDVELAKAINVTATSVLGQEASNLNALVVYYSTDYVFDGSKDGYYTEADVPNPQGVYGATKLAGEQALQASGARHLILRTSWVVGAHGGNFAKTMLRLACERDAINVVADQFGAPTSAALLADLTAHLVRQASQNATDFPYGLYHTVADGVTNWHEYACYVIEKARAHGSYQGKPVQMAPDAIRPINTADYPTPAKRPINSRLDTTKLRQTFGLHLPNWRVGLDHILEQIL